jgi:uncharacterized SAM-binding protein YcdF (DUF218 family)
MLKDAAEFLIVPPINLAVYALLGVLVAGRWPRTGRKIAGVSLVLFLALAMPVVQGSLLDGLEHWRKAPVAAPPAAIVILGGDVAPVAGDPGIDIGPLTLERLRGGVALARRTHLPILVSGGLVGPVGPPVAELMAHSLDADFGVPARWVEPRSADTWENARFSAAILRRDGVSSIYLVTHPWHMRRALFAFSGLGLDVTPAPLPLDGPATLVPSTFVPRVSSLRLSYFAMHEWIGDIYYRLRAALG